MGYCSSTGSNRFWNCRNFSNTVDHCSSTWLLGLSILSPTRSITIHQPVETASGIVDVFSDRSITVHRPVEPASGIVFICFKSVEQAIPWMM
ncbi:hypothetical protein M0R45_009026 [Rubus argutus]|uniref:Uncharacterized protein n=1 Tax=Rubus argutus TaxID=59490 RepID=A0AAW1Y2U9_RUBAR